MMRESKIILKSFFLKHNYIDYFWFALFPFLRETKIFIVLIIVSIITYSRLQLRIKNDYRGLINTSIILNKVFGNSFGNLYKKKFFIFQGIY